MAIILKFKRKNPVDWDQMIAMIESGPYRRTKLLNLLSILESKSKQCNGHSKLEEYLLIQKKIRDVKSRLKK